MSDEAKTLDSDEEILLGKVQYLYESIGKFDLYGKVLEQMMPGIMSKAYDDAYYNVVKYILELKNGGDFIINYCDVVKNVAEKIFKNNNLKALKMLSSVKSVKRYIEQQRGALLLDNLVKENKLDLVKYLLDMNLIIKRDKFKALSYFIDSFDFKNAKVLMNCDKNLKIVRYYNYEIITNCIENKNIEFVKILHNEFKINISLSNGLFFLTACETGNMALVNFYIEKGIDIHINNDEAICRAARSGNLKLVIYLHKNYGIGCNIQAHNNRAIINASIIESFDIIKYCHLHGCSISVQNDLILMRAVESGNLEIIDYCLKNGCIFRPDMIRCHYGRDACDTDLLEYCRKNKINIYMEGYPLKNKQTPQIVQMYLLDKIKIPYNAFVAEDDDDDDDDEFNNIKKKKVAACVIFFTYKKYVYRKKLRLLIPIWFHPECPGGKRDKEKIKQFLGALI